MPVFGTVRRHGDRSPPHGRTGTCGRDELPPGSPQPLFACRPPMRGDGESMHAVLGGGDKGDSSGSWRVRISQPCSRHPTPLGRDLCIEGKAQIARCGAQSYRVAKALLAGSALRRARLLAWVASWAAPAWNWEKVIVPADCVAMVMPR